MNTDGIGIDSSTLALLYKSGNVDLPNLNAIDVSVNLEGTKAKTWKELEPLYKKHAATVGFNVRKSTQRKEGGEIVEKYFVCSCEGKPPFEKESSTQRNHSITRTECKAHLRVKLEDGVFVVKTHVMVHNHKLTRPEWQYLHCGERSISKQKGEAMKIMDKAGIGPSAAFSYLAHNAGGEQNAGHTKKDHQNFINRERREDIIDRKDAQTVMTMLLERQRKEPVTPLLGEDGKFEGVIWRDATMKIDYERFGHRDVVVFDTTYKTNRFGLVCAPFVGINNHWNTVMFACALIKNETKKTFMWLFREFLSSMDNKKPATIFTDQDAAMAAAIAKVFGQETKHRLCLWHLHKNAVGHYGKLKKNKEFKEAFAHCLRGCVDRIKFEECWMKMVNKFELREDSWFTRLYSIKEKWCTALSKDFFSAGILSPQRSERTNQAISFNATQTTSLTQFLEIFSTTVERWRSTERNNEFKCSRSMPRTNVPTGIMKHAAEVYTETIFRFFEAEFQCCLVSQAVVELKLGSKTTYLVSPEDSPDPKTRVLVICTIEKDKVEITCACKHFEEVGWLCSHCLRVLYINNIRRIPDQYIKKRWGKDVKDDVWNKLGEEKRKERNDDRLCWREYMSRRYCDLVIKAESNVDARRILEDAYTINSLAIEEMISSIIVEEEFDMTRETTQASNAGEIVTKEIRAIIEKRVLDPDKAKTKGKPGKQQKSFGTKRKANTAQLVFDQPKKKQII